MDPDTELGGWSLTGLMLAAMNGREDIVKMLQEKYGADVEKGVFQFHLIGRICQDDICGNKCHA